MLCAAILTCLNKTAFDLVVGVLVNIWAVHHDPATWTDPEKYNPDRFLSADGKSVVQHESFIPFGTGNKIPGVLLIPFSFKQ